MTLFWGAIKTQGSALHTIDLWSTNPAVRALSPNCKAFKRFCGLISHRGCEKVHLIPQKCTVHPSLEACYRLIPIGKSRD